MPALITTAIPQQAYELIRDRIGLIIATELPNQFTLNSIAGSAPLVYVERYAKIDSTECPVINVCIDKGDYDNQDPTVARGTFIFNIDVYAKAASSSSVRGDAKSLTSLHRVMGLCRAIIQDARYLRLGYDPGFIAKRQVTAILIAQPDQSIDTNNVVMGRLTIQVVAPEISGFAEGIAIGGYDTQVKLHETELGYVFSGDDFPVPPPTGSEIKINGGFLTDLNCGDLLDISVLDEDGNAIGTIISESAVEVGSATVQLKNSLDTLLSTDSALPEAITQIAAPDGVASAVNSALDVLGTVDVPSGGAAEIQLADVTHTQSDGSPVILPCGDPMICTPIAPCDDASVTVNGTAYGTAPSGGSENVEVLDEDGDPRGYLYSGIWRVGNTKTNMNGVTISDLNPEVNLNTFATLNGVQSGSWNAGTKTWETTVAPDLMYMSDYVAPYHYSGTAVVGSLTSASVWLITRTLVNVDFTVTNTTATNVAWDDRLTAIYT